MLLGECVKLQCIIRGAVRFSTVQNAQKKKQKLTPGPLGFWQMGKLAEDVARCVRHPYKPVNKSLSRQTNWNTNRVPMDMCSKLAET